MIKKSQLEACLVLGLDSELNRCVINQDVVRHSGDEQAYVPISLTEILEEHRDVQQSHVF